MRPPAHVGCGQETKTEFIDGHKRIMVEHTLHVLVLPGLHPHSRQPSGNTPTAAGGLLPHSESSVSLHDYVTMATPSSTRNRHPDISLWPPSPFHLVLRIITRLSFNEAGKITHHRDFWDVKVSTPSDLTSRTHAVLADQCLAFPLNRTGSARSCPRDDVRSMGHWPSRRAGHPERR